MARVDGYCVPVDHAQFGDKIKHLRHDLELENHRIVAFFAEGYIFVSQPVFLSGPNGLENAILTEGLQRRDVADYLILILLTNVVEQLIRLAHLIILLGLVDKGLYSLSVFSGGSLLFFFEHFVEVFV